MHQQGCRVNAVNSNSFTFFVRTFQTLSDESVYTCDFNHNVLVNNVILGYLYYNISLQSLIYINMLHPPFWHGFQSSSAVLKSETKLLILWPSKFSQLPQVILVVFDYTKHSTSCRVDSVQRVLHSSLLDFGNIAMLYVTLILFDI